jgi:hypothetical protein
VLERDPHLESERDCALRVLLYLFRRDEAVQHPRAGRPGLPSSTGKYGKHVIFGPSGATTGLLNCSYRRKFRIKFPTPVEHGIKSADQGFNSAHQGMNRPNKE